MSAVDSWQAILVSWCVCRLVFVGLWVRRVFEVFERVDFVEEQRDVKLNKLNVGRMLASAGGNTQAGWLDGIRQPVQGLAMSSLFVEPSAYSRVGLSQVWVHCESLERLHEFWRLNVQPAMCLLPMDVTHKLYRQ